MALKGTCNAIFNVLYRSHYHTLSLSPLNVVFTPSLAVYNDSKLTDSLPVASSIKICFSSIAGRHEKPRFSQSISENVSPEDGSPLT